MVVVRLGARVPLKSLAPCRSLLTTRKVTKTRINLFGTTKTDSVTNLKLAKSILQSSASAFMSKWNFNPITETPLTKGRFSWTPFNSSSVSKLRVPNEKMEESDLPSEQIDNSWRHSDEDRTRDEDQESILPACPNLSPLIHKLNLDNREESEHKGTAASGHPTQTRPTSQSKTESPKKSLRQPKITEFGKIVKRRPRNILCKAPVLRRLM